MKVSILLSGLLSSPLAFSAAILPRQPQSSLLASLGEGNTGSAPEGYSIRSMVSRGFNSVIRGLISRSAQEIKLVSRTVMTPQLSPNATRHKLRYGPLTVLSPQVQKPWTLLSSLDPNGESFIRMFQPGTICKQDCTVLGGQIYVETVDGKKSDRSTGVYDHHTLSFDFDKQGYNPIGLCDAEFVDQKALVSSKAQTTGFIGSSEDNSETPTIYTSRDGSIKSGYHMQRNNKIYLQADLVNYSNETQDVFIAYEIESVPGLVGWDAATTLISVTGCSAAPPVISKTERTVTTSKNFPILVDGAILGAKGHMHNGGEKMVLMVNDKTICESDVKYNGDSIAGMSYCNADYPIKRGDSLKVQSIYDLTKHPLRPGSDGAHEAHSSMGGEDIMGMWGLTVAIDQSKTATSKKLHNTKRDMRSAMFI